MLRYNNIGVGDNNIMYFQMHFCDLLYCINESRIIQSRQMRITKCFNDFTISIWYPIFFMSIPIALYIILYSLYLRCTLLLLCIRFRGILFYRFNSFWIKTPKPSIYIHFLNAISNVFRTEVCFFTNLIVYFTIYLLYIHIKKKWVHILIELNTNIII